MIAIDVQESFRQRDSWDASSNPAVADEVRRLVDHARSLGDLVVWVTHSEPDSGGVFDPERGFNRLLPGLTPTDDEPRLVKTSHNAFTSTPLARILVERGIRSVRICGIRTEQCCETTARLASDLGYDVTFVIDATATEPIPSPDAPRGRSIVEVLADPGTLHTSDIITRTRFVLADRFARIATVDEVTGGG